MHEARAEIIANVWKLIAAPGDDVGVGDVIAVLEIARRLLDANRSPE